MKTGEDIARRFTEVSREILESSRNELYFYMRYLGLALSGLDFVITTDLPGIGTDGASLVVNPKILADLYQKDRRLVTRIYLHEVYHCLFRHIFRKMPRQQDYWMLACDMAVEFLIDSGDGRAVRMPRSRYRMNVRSFYEKQVKVLNAESIYRALCRVNPDENEIARLRREFCVDDHSLWPSRQPDRNPELPPSAAKLKDKWDDISRKTQTEMESFSKDTSRGAQDLLEQTKVENRERYDYQSFLRKFAVLREEMHVDDDSFDYVLYTYGLNFYGNMPLIEPQEMREVKKIEEFVIVVDVSMSVSGPLVHTFLEQTYNVLSESESFLKKVNIRILQCDEEVRSDVRIHSKKEYYALHRKNKVKRQFDVSAPNTVWVSDITKFKIKGIYYHVCVVMDLFSRKVVGYKISPNASTQIVTSSFKMAFKERGYPENLLFHSDQGCQYTSKAFRKLLTGCSVDQSFSHTGTPIDNAVSESFFSNLKKEEMYRHDYRSEREFKTRISRYIAHYNQNRPHSYNNYRSPDEKETQYYTHLEE